jgi:hypothetical protein
MQQQKIQAGKYNLPFLMTHIYAVVVEAVAARVEAP